MSDRNCFLRLVFDEPRISAVLLFTFLVVGMCYGQEEILHRFNNTSGEHPQGSLVLDSVGNLYGTTSEGGYIDYGTVFELMPVTGGGFQVKLLHKFSSGSDGSFPAAGLVQDSAGNLYGTTSAGGGGSCQYAVSDGCGTVFELSVNGAGGFSYSVLHSFNNDGVDGTDPVSSLVLDGLGNLYGTTYSGGTGTCRYPSKGGCGTVFELTPNGDGSWTESTLYSFKNDGADGVYPLAKLTFDSAGNLYGTTSHGGTGKHEGTVFELSPPAGGGWTEKVLHNFGDPSDGRLPFPGVVFDTKGNLYGTTFEGGLGNAGIVFELSPLEDGTWTETILHNGGMSYGDLIIDANGNLYGTQFDGGTNDFSGTVFELSNTGPRSWTFRVLHDFLSTPVDGTAPFGGLIFDSSGNLYGTTRDGGGLGFLGTVYEIKR